MTTLIIRAINARSLVSVTTFEKQDPYMTLEVSPTDLSILNHTKQVHKTKVHEDGNKRADWNEAFVFQMEDHTAMTLTLEVYNDNLGKDDLIGRVRVDLAPIFAKADRPMDVEFEETIEILSPKNVSVVAGKILLGFKWHNEELRIKTEAAKEQAQLFLFAEKARQEELERQLAEKTAREAETLREIEEMKKQLADAQAAAAKATELAAKALASVDDARVAVEDAEKERARLSKLEEESRVDALSAATEELAVDPEPAQEDGASESETDSDQEPDKPVDAPPRRRKKKAGILKRIGRALR